MKMKEVLFICPSEVLKTSLMKGELGSLSNVKICSLNDLEEDQDIFHEEKVIIVDEAQDIFFKKENFNKINNILGNFFTITPQFGVYLEILLDKKIY